METAPHQASDARRSIASVEGYLALVLLVLPWLTPSIDHPSKDMIIGRAVYTGAAFGLALGGVRFGKGGGRLAAWVALIILSFWLLIVLALSIVRWEQVLWYWHH